jgi:hypothetical protein
MMNYSGGGRKLSWPNFNVLSQHLSGGTEVLGLYECICNLKNPWERLHLKEAMT